MLSIVLVQVADTVRKNISHVRRHDSGYYLNFEGQWEDWEG